MGALTIAAGILIAVGIIVAIRFVIALLVVLAERRVFESKPNPRPLTIIDTPEGMAEASYYRSQNCKANTETGNWMCPENTQTWTDFQNQ